MFGATVFNIVVMIAIFVLLSLLLGLLPITIGPQATTVVLIGLFVGSIALTYFIYHRVVKWISNKWDLDKYFDPIFRRRGGPGT
jgi:hypothetical protein